MHFGKVCGNHGFKTILHWEPSTKNWAKHHQIFLI